MTRTILAGPVQPPPAFHNTLARDTALSQFTPGGLMARGLGRFHQKTDAGDPPDLKNMSEEKFRGIVLAGVDEAKEKAAGVFDDNKALRKLCEDTFAEFKKSQTTAEEMGKKLLLLEKSALEAQGHARRSMTIRERIRSNPDILAKIGEALLKGVRGEGGANIVIRGEGETTSPAGAVLISPEIAGDIYALEQQYTAARIFDYRTMGHKSEKLVVEVDEPDAFVIAEAMEFPEVALNLALVPLDSKKIGALIPVTNELLQDSVINIGDYVSGRLARGNAKRVDTIALVADGTNNALFGGFVGAFNYFTQVNAKAGHTSAELMDYSDYLAVLAAVDPAVLETPDCTWIMNPRQIVRALAVKDQNGRPIFLNALDAPAQGRIGSILGYPVSLAARAPSANVAGSQLALFGDPKGYAVGSRLEYELAFSDHVKFTSDQRVYRGKSRKAFGGKRVDAMAVLKNAGA